MLFRSNYPEAPVTGDAIHGLDDAASVEGVQVLHAGTKAVGDEIHTAGGRVLSVTAVGADLAEARHRAYEAISKISIRGAHYRSDIALKAAQV